jgi:hypothetical protein
MCQQGSFKLVRVKIPADLSCSGRAKWKKAQIDSCIAPIVGALQKGGIDMRGSCCGHGRGDGDIQLQDGRTLIIRRGEIFRDDENNPIKRVKIDYESLFRFLMDKNIKYASKLACEIKKLNPIKLKQKWEG